MTNVNQNGENGTIENGSFDTETTENKAFLPKNKRKKERIVLLDFLRGLLMLWVFFDHFLYDCFGIFRFDFTTENGRNLVKFSINYWNGLYRSIAHPIVLFLFFAISGIVTVFSRNHLKRALKITGFAVLTFLGTFIADWFSSFGLRCTITVGVLYAFAVCDLFVLLFEKIKTNKYVYLVLGVILSVIGLLYYYQTVTVFSDKLFFIVWDRPFFMSGKSADYFPVLPYLGYFFIGVFLGKTVYKDKKPKIKLSNGTVKALSPVSYIGRTSIWWYFISQFLFLAVLYIFIVLGVL